MPGRPISRSLLLIGEGPTLFGDQAKSPTAARFVDDSPLEQSGFELSVPLALKLVVSRKRELDGGILIGDDDGMIP